jgi:hypothetical protein
MTLLMTRYGFGSLALIGALTLAACSGSPAASMSPTGPSGAVGSTASFNPNPDEPPPPCETSTSINNDTEPCEPPPPPPPPPLGDQGCTPGYWKANVKKGAGEWTQAGLAPTHTVGTVFAAPGYNGYTLLQALEFGGGPGVSGATQNLLRAAVAAVLNASNSDVAYPRTRAAIVTAVNAAIASGNRNTMLALAGELDADNNLGCPLNNSGN